MHHPKATHALPTQTHSRPESQVGDQDEVLKQPSQTVSIQGSASPKCNTHQGCTQLRQASDVAQAAHSHHQALPLMRAIPMNQNLTKTVLYAVSGHASCSASVMI